MDSLVRFSEINQSKPFDFHLMLSNQKIAELVKRLDLLSIKKVSLVGFLSPLSINEWSLKAELRAIVKQKCVISFKPVKTIVCETVNRTFLLQPHKILLKQLMMMELLQLCLMIPCTSLMMK